MAKGPPPQLYEVKKGAGNPGKRKLNRGPAYRAKRPRCPANLKGEARRLFRQLAPLLFENSLLNECTLPAFLTLCTVGGMAFEAEKAIQREGFVVKCQRGMRARPEVGIFLRAAAEFRHWCQEFGLTPVSVQRVPTRPRTESLEDLVR